MLSRGDIYDICVDVLERRFNVILRGRKFLYDFILSMRFGVFPLFLNVRRFSLCSREELLRGIGRDLYEAVCKVVQERRGREYLSFEDLAKELSFCMDVEKVDSSGGGEYVVIVKDLGYLDFCEGLFYGLVETGEYEFEKLDLFKFKVREKKGREKVN